MGLRSFIGKMFGTDKAVDNLIDQTGNALDKLFYTKEEKAEAHAQDISEARKMVIEWMKNTQGQNIARRLIALIVTGIWAVEHIVASTLSVIAVWVTNSENFVKSSQVIAEYADSITGAMMLVLSFYFAAPYAGDIIKGALERFGKR
jgi:hypothetical protein